MQDRTNDEPPLSPTPDDVSESPNPTQRPTGRRELTPFLAGAAERVVAAHYLKSDARRGLRPGRAYYLVYGADPRVSLAAVSAQQFHDYPNEASTKVGMMMAMGMVGMTKKERASRRFLEREREFVSYIRTIKELMPEIEAQACNTWIAALKEGGSL